MVDFNNDVTIGTPAVDVVRILILQRRSDLIEALEKFNKMEYQNAGPDISVVRARLVSLFIELQAGLRRRLKEKDFNSLEKAMGVGDKNNILYCINFLNGYLDEIRLIRLDNKPNVDKTKWEEVNKAYGY